MKTTSIGPWLFSIIAVLAAGVTLDLMHIQGGPLAFSTVAAGIITFFYFASAEQKPGKRGQAEGSLRTAIAAAIIVEYMVMVGFTAYFAAKEVVAQPPPGVANLLVTNFTTVVGVVIASYFGATAYLEGKREAIAAGGQDDVLKLGKEAVFAGSTQAVFSPSGETAASQDK